MSPRRWPTVLGTLAVLFAGVTGAHAHVHLCFEGQEPPASIHGAHGGHDHHSLEDDRDHDDHDDIDVDLEEPVLVKAFKPDHSLIASALISLAPLVGHAAVAAIGGPGKGPDPPIPFVRPLLRAPPRNL
jgi:hypothetical protein